VNQIIVLSVKTVLRLS